MRALLGNPKLAIVGGQQAALTLEGNASSPGIDGCSGRENGTVQQVRFRSGFHLILGSCFGGDLPATSITGAEEAKTAVRALGYY
jgi:hypothetical protein